MKNGIYHIRLSSGNRSVDGIMLIRDGALNGGGSGYFYQGALTLDDKTLTGKLTIIKWDPDTPPSLGLFKEITLPVKGEYDSIKSSLHFQGQAAGHHAIHIQAVGHRLASLI